MKIFYEDNHIIVVLKEENIPMQEDSSKDLDLLNIVKNYIKEKYKKPGNVFLGLVHRLDRPVGGIVVFAKTSKAASRLSNQIRENKFEKRYVALVHNKTKTTDELIDYILKDEKTFSSFITKNNEGKKSILKYNLIKYINNMSLVDIELITGRHHQIRVQMANAGHPIYGDQRYGIDQEKIQIHLYAYKLKFYHPISNEELEFIQKPKWYV